MNERKVVVSERKDLGMSIAEEVRTLQGLKEEIDSYKKDLAKLAESKDAGSEELNKLLREIERSTQKFEELNKKRWDAVSETEKNIEESKKRLKFQQSLENIVVESVQTLKATGQELERFVKERRDARIEALNEKESLKKVKADKKGFLDEFDAKKAELEEERKELDEYKTYLEDYSEKLSAHVGAAKQVIKFVNELMAANKLPAKYEMPSEIEIIKFE